MTFPIHRLRRLRKNDAIRRLVRETTLTTDDLIYPLFVVGEDNIRSEMLEISRSYYLSGQYLVEEAKGIKGLGIPAVLLFGIPLENQRDESASLSYSPLGPVQKAAKILKSAVPDLTIITDVCLCEYTTHRHCGIIKDKNIDNDLTLEVIQKIALSHAEAGSDVIAPSAMMDGMVQAIRSILDIHGFSHTLIMPYSVKYASNLYGPFKKSTNSKPVIGKNQTHQIDFANSNQALREAKADIDEGADIIIVKPALTCLDIVYRIKQTYNIPVATYNVSGEYSMIHAAGEKNLIDRDLAIYEILTCMKRAGADMIITYFAKEAANLLNRQRVINTIHAQ
jgi:porphobilinogen synthase